MLTMDTKIPYEYAHIWSLSVSSTHFLLQRWIYKSIYRYNNPHINLAFICKRIVWFIVKYSGIGGINSDYRILNVNRREILLKEASKWFGL